MSDLLKSQAAEEFLRIGSATEKSAAVSDARTRRVHQVAIEKVIFALLKEKDGVELEEIHAYCKELELQSKRLIGSIVNKLIGKEYVRSEEREGVKSGFVYVRGRRYGDWATALQANLSNS